MKNIILFTAVLLYANSCFSQQLINRKNRLTSSVTEKYHTVIETDKEVKQGEYQAFYNKTILVANGRFDNNTKTGIWSFYNRRGEIIERFNYNTNTLLAEAAEDSTSSIRYTFDDHFKTTDYVTKPIKIGGRYYGYVPYLKLFKIPADMSNIRHEEFQAILELLISPGGRLADYKIHLKSATYERVININPDLLTDEAKQFMPATLNKQPITARIFIYCYITDFDDIDMD